MYVAMNINIMYSIWLKLIAHIPTRNCIILFSTKPSALHASMISGFHTIDQLLTNDQGRILTYQLL